MDATGSQSNPTPVPPLHVVLYQPEIPQNTGNIGRTCVALGAKLWIVRPVGFRLDASQLKRAGLDYWQHLNWEAVDNWEQLRLALPDARIWLLTKFGKRSYHTAQFARGDALVFGRETSGLPDKLRSEYAEQQLAIPMPGPVRSLNLATAAGIVVYAAAHQIGLLDACSLPQS
ncbi:MAG: tRNA (cytidine(34)-2'-O)-methyltransferase [Pirellulaceae bacterium]|nr:tRNA (cytidine(34)-2'-O)-methyltransferase [Pirellulaceae bacterium]